MKNKIYIASRFLTQSITGVQRYGIELSKAIKKINGNFDLNFIAPKNILPVSYTHLTLPTKA